MQGYGENAYLAAGLFFTAIFLAFRGALAEVLIVWCRHVTTALYIDTIIISVCSMFQEAVTKATFEVRRILHLL